MYSYLSYFLSALFVVFFVIGFWFVINIKQFKNMDYLRGFKLWKEKSYM